MRLYDKALYKQHYDHHWQTTVAPKYHEQRSKQRTPYAVLAHTLLNIHRAEQECHALTLESMNQDEHHIVFPGDRFPHSRAYIESHLNEFGWLSLETHPDEDSRPALIARRWPDVAAAGLRLTKAQHAERERHLAAQPPVATPEQLLRGESGNLLLIGAYLAQGRMTPAEAEAARVLIYRRELQVGRVHPVTLKALAGRGLLVQAEVKYGTERWQQRQQRHFVPRYDAGGQALLF